MEWRTIPSHPAYEASDEGHIRRRDTARPLSLTVEKNGYVKAKLWEDGHQVNAWVQRLVCEAFHGPAPAPKLDAAHGNRIRTDNRPDNLGWKTRKENEADKVIHGVANIGSRNGGAVLTEEQVREIRRRLPALPRSTGGVKFKKGALGKLAAEYGVTANCVRQAASTRWRHLT